MPEISEVTLRGGPFDGTTAQVVRGTTLVVFGDPLAVDRVARYRPSRERGVYTFRGLDRIVARIPAHEDAEAGHGDREATSTQEPRGGGL